MANAFLTNGSWKCCTVPLALAAALTMTACGQAGGGDRTDTDTRALANLAAFQRHDEPGPVDLDPEVDGRELMRLKRVGDQMGTSDLVKYGADGSAVVIMAYGGGGEKIMRCMLHDGELARMRKNLAALPLDKPKPAPEPPRQTFYTKPPTQYTLQAGRRIETFTENEMPRKALPFVRRLKGTLSGDAASCRLAYRSRHL
jgi:hypothetical protein